MLDKRSWLYVVLILAVISASWLLLQRIPAEAPRVMDAVLDYREWERLASRVGTNPLAALAEVRPTGVPSVAIAEETLDTLEKAGQISLYTAATFRTLVRSGASGEWRHLTEADLPLGHTVVVAGIGPRADRLVNALERRFGRDRVLVRPGRSTVLIDIDHSLVSAREIGLFLDPDLVREVAALGFKVVPRFSNSPGLDGAGIREIIKALPTPDGRFPYELFIASGLEMPGYPGHLTDLSRELAGHGLDLGLLEAPVQRGFVNQLGFEKVAQALDYRVIRVYAISEAELEKLTPEIVVDRWVRAARERNIRAIYLRPFVKGIPHEQLLTYNLDFFASSVKALERAGYPMGDPEPFAPVSPARWLQIIVSLGIIAGGWLVMDHLFGLPDRWGRGMAVLGVLGTALAYLRFRTWAELGFAFLAAVIFPSLAIGLQLRHWAQRRPVEAGSTRGLLGEGVLALLRASAVSLLGALFIAALLSDIRYLLEFELFRGVKAVHVLPLGLVGLYYLRYFGLTTRAGERPAALWPEIRRLLRETVRVHHLVLLGLAAAVAYIYLGRTGHEAGLTVSRLEIAMRDYVEKLMITRPRTKEFLAGHPALLAAAALWRFGHEKQLFLAALAATIGQISLVNSFEHLRTPVLISLLRTGNGLVLGLLAGALAVALLWAVDLAWRRWGLGERL